METVVGRLRSEKGHEFPAMHGGYFYSIFEKCLLLNYTNSSRLLKCKLKDILKMFSKEKITSNNLKTKFTCDKRK